jgi:MFS family permease
VFYQLPQIAIALFSGVLVDRLPRKPLLIFSDIGSACCTISVGILAAFGSLQVWHIYLIAAIIGCFGNVQSLTYSTLIPLIVPKQHHTRASSMGAMVVYGSDILAPALAGVLYPVVGLLGITVIDMTTFAIAMFTLLIIQIPPTVKTQEAVKETKTIWHDVTFGFRYIASQPSLLALVIAMSAFTFLNQITETLYQPMILARTGGDAQILGMVVAASGVGGVVGAITVTVWGGFRRRVFGVLISFIGTGCSKLLLGLGHLPTLWVAGRLGASFPNPLMMSSYMAIWYAKVAPEQQGRVLAADYLIGTVIQVSGGLSAGLLADYVFEPALQSSEWLALPFQTIVGSGSGSGMALLITMSAIAMAFIGMGGFTVRQLRDAEILLTEHDLTQH